MADPAKIRGMLESLAKLRDRRQQELGAVAEMRKRLPREYGIPADATAEQVMAEARKAAAERDKLDAQLTAAEADLAKRFPDLVK